MQFIKLFCCSYTNFNADLRVTPTVNLNIIMIVQIYYLFSTSLKHEMNKWKNFF